MELIAVIILVGVIATFTGFFLYTGFNGYLNAKKNADGAFNAQMALDRIALELRDINQIDGAPTISSITYKSEKLTGTRTLSYSSTDKRVSLSVDTNNYPLLEDVADFKLYYNYMNLDDDTAPTLEVAHIDVELKLNDVDRQFTTKVFPRNMIEKTW